MLEPTITAYLQTPSMHDPWESHQGQRAAARCSVRHGQNGGGGPEVDVYDISQDCRLPQLIVTAPVGTALSGKLGASSATKAAGRPTGSRTTGAICATASTTPSTPPIYAAEAARELGAGHCQRARFVDTRRRQARLFRIAWGPQ